MSKHYINEIGTEIIVNCGEDISTASIHKIKVKKPSGVKVEWNADIHEINYLKYIIATDDFNEVGEYSLQSYIEIGGWKGHGETVKFDIRRHFG